ncbi:MAG: phenylalanine--tRNA ligase subunit beta, partial [Schleiferiaceae bacterium]|nr:phenylalanine--tRNA ligase subunit beta [Schleiferiaceae bacterium]
DGIMVLPEESEIGMAASKLFSIENDSVIEIGLTPNRTDAMCHYGVARDLRAGLLRKGENHAIQLPSVSTFKVDNNSRNIEVEVVDREACGQYFGLTLTKVKVEESPDWLKNRLKSIGLSPKNNVVDITNFVLHETGHPLHAFDAEKISTNKVSIKTLPSGSKFTSLDDKERELNEKDLMICDGDTPLCIAGVLGGASSGVGSTTTEVFLEAAWFNPVSVRKTARRHGLNTDASFRYERGVDPDMTEYALKRAAMLIKELGGGEISSEIQSDIVHTFEPAKIKMSFERINTLIGQEIPKEDVREILNSLDIHVNAEVDDSFEVTVPLYRADVTREADVIEEILRIYGFNAIELPSQMSFSVIPSGYLPSELRASMNQFLTARGFYEIQNNSLTKESYYSDYEEFPSDKRVGILNPLSGDLNVMSQSLLFGMMEVVLRNINHKNPDLKLVEFGKNYFKTEKGFKEEEVVAISLTGNTNNENWNEKSTTSNFFQLKGEVVNLLSRFGVTVQNESSISSELYGDAIQLESQKLKVATVGIVSNKVLNQFGVAQSVYYAEINWKNFEKVYLRHKSKYSPVGKYPAVRRDLALLVDKNVKYADIELTAKKNVKGILKSVNLFDVYEGKNLPEGKKSYALSFIFQDDTKTLTDKVIDKMMQKLIVSFEKGFAASLR